jgi:hypothetical protein
MKTSPTSIKIRQIITQLKERKLVPRPQFQRRLVWASVDKIRFVDTVLRGYPFPEIYVANGPVDVDTGEGQQLLVDGQQRVTTLAAYFQGDPSTFGTAVAKTAPDPLDAVQRLEKFFDLVDGEEETPRSEAIGIYAKASLQASNDRINRVRRGVIFEAVMLGADPDKSLRAEGLL